MNPLILMYHRIADEPIDYWGLAVSPARFEEHLHVLRRTRQPLPLAEFVRQLTAGTLPSDAVAVTFDDGYVDNLVAGLPRLEAAEVPATVFLATGFVDHPEPFWWDELAGFILLASGPKSFEVVIQGQTRRFDLDAHSPAAGAGAATPAAALKSRHAPLEAIYQPLRGLDEEERSAIIVELRSIFAERDGRASLGRAMTSDEVRKLVASGLVTIGAHTVTHPILPALEPAARRNEVTISKLACEALVGAPVTSFAYPFGEFSAAACETVQSAGFAFACSTGRAPTVAASDLFALRRIYIPNLDGDAFEHRIRSA
jgi:peptidoglycan/xylan/chitin deacetylase (PgdA/CDA1 family)